MSIPCDNDLNLQQQRIALLLEYFGPSFSGCQIQNNAYTVQEALQDALSELHIPHTSVNFSGRTDAGVHALGQVGHFDTTMDNLKEIPDLVSSLNAVLPSSVSVKAGVFVPDFDFHSTVSAQWRWYRYRLFNHPVRSVWMRQDAVWLRHPLDVNLMKEGASLFLGEHDFQSFKCPKSQIKNNRCHVIHSRIHQEAEYVVFDIVANRFLYKMVRNIMGLLIQIGLGKDFTPQDIPRVLDQRDRQMAGPAAYPQGLSLMAVQYPKPWDFFQNDVYVTNLNQIVQESSHHEKNILRKAS